MNKEKEASEADEPFGDTLMHGALGAMKLSYYYSTAWKKSN